MFRLSIISLLMMAVSESHQYHAEAAQLFEKQIKGVESAETALVTDDGVKEHKRPFTEKVEMEIAGTIIMAILIALSNAGGLSGAGTNIPIMLIFFDMTMKDAVPISGFVAVCATVFRFIINFRQMHPTNPNKLSINYEVVMIAMPAVFMGSFIGVYANSISESWVQVALFATTVAWSIYTTSKKAIQLRAKEKIQDELKAKGAIPNTETLLKPKGGNSEILESGSAIDMTPDMAQVIHE